MAAPTRVPAPDGTRVDEAPLLVLPEGTSFKGMKLSYLAAGGMSVAYKGVGPEGVVFVKEVPKAQAQAVVSLTQEKALLERLKHPAIPRLRDFCDWRDHLYLVQDFIEGTNLEQQISPFPDIFLAEAKVRDWALQLCDILDYLHQQTPPIIYRDLKPKNVLLHPSGRLYLVDFGIARAYKEGKDQDTRLLGSVLTASPEHYGGQTDARSDLYTLGATLHYLLTNGQGERVSPFDFPPISAVRPDVSRELQAILEKCLQRSPEQRYASAAQLRLALQGGRAVEVAPPSPPVPSEPPAAAASPPRRGLPPWAQVGLGLVMGWLLSGLFKRSRPTVEASPRPTASAEVSLVLNPTPTASRETPLERPLPPPASPPPPRPTSRPTPAYRPPPPPPQPRPQPTASSSPIRPRVEPDEPDYPQRPVTSSNSSPSGSSAQPVLEQLGLPWGHFQDLNAQSDRGARTVGQVEGPAGLFQLEAPPGFRYLGSADDFLLLRMQRRNVEIVRVRTLTGQTHSPDELALARQQQLAGQVVSTTRLEFQGRTLPALVLQVPSRRFQVVEVLWSQSSPPFIVSVSGGAAMARFPAYLDEFQAHLRRFQI